MISHVLVLPQPWAWLVVDGQLEVANLWMPPREELIGKRIGIVGGGLEEAQLWNLPEWYGVKFRGVKNNYHAGMAHTQRGPLGTVELEGWIHYDVATRKAKSQVRPGNDKKFRMPKGLISPCGWILKRGKFEKLPSEGLRVLRAHHDDRKDYQERVLSYAKRFGTVGLGRDHLALLERLGFRPEEREKADNERREAVGSAD